MQSNKNDKNIGISISLTIQNLANIEILQLLLGSILKNKRFKKILFPSFENC
jgi:hypothetical protein